MTIQEQIATIRATLDTVDAGIGQIQAALATAAAGDKAALRAALAELEGQRANLQMQLANLEASAVVVAPLGEATRGRAPGGLRAARRRTASTGRGRAATPSSARSKALNRKLTVTTLKIAADLRTLSQTLTLIGDDPTQPRPGGKKLL
jgi:hypothetical protein